MRSREFRFQSVRQMFILSFLTAIFLCFGFLALPVNAIPPNFEDVLVANVGAPTALAFTPDGRLLITTQTGQVRVYQNGSLLVAPAIDLNSRLCTNSERGLLGVAVDPDFANNRYVYFYYTFNKFSTCPTGQPTNPNNPVNRVARFVLADNNTIAASSETILINNIHSPAGNHNGGDLHFGKDGLLYVSVGDGGADYAGDSGGAGANDAARDKHVLLGKILRVTRSGAIPSGNPHLGLDSDRCNTTGITTPGKWCQEIYATGLRNPFRIAFDSNAANTRFFINDVGQNVWEEIDEGLIGADYGWNIREGNCANNSTSNCGAPPAGLTNPVFAYQHTGDCSAAGVRGNSITGGAFVPRGFWSAEYDDVYLFGEYVCGKIFQLKPQAGGGFAATEFATGLGGNTPVAMIFGPDGTSKALYYTAYTAGGAVRKIRFTGTANRNPVAAIAASPRSGLAPLNVAFNASASSDPDGDPLSFNWNFGDGATGTGATPTHTYTTNGTYNPTVTVTDGRGGSNTASLRIDVGNSAPQPLIISPTASQLFRVGETITLRGSATDPQQGDLPDSSLTWEVILHHNNDHTHPYLPPTVGNNVTFTAPAPEDINAATGSFLEIRLKATDALGLSTTIVQNFQPRKVNITLATNPSGLNLTVNNVGVTGPTTIVSWDGYALNVNAPNQAGYTFQSWSDGGAAAHTITTPATAATYTANFQTGGGGGTLPAGWSTQDVGSVGTAGSASFSGGTWTVKGSGADIWNTADGFRYVYQPLSGNGQITARVASVGNTDVWAKAGVMIRENLTAGSPQAMAVVTPASGVAFQRRTSAGAASVHTAGASVTAPYWVRLVRSGSTFTAYSSPNGTTWTQIGTATITMGQNVYIGLAVTAHNNSALNTSTFTNVSVVSNGLVGEYFDNRDFTNLVTTRRDASVNFDWGTGTPAGTSLTGPDTFSVRWTGRVLAPATGAYTFTTSSDDGVRLWVNNQLLIDNWTDHGVTNNSGTINLTASNYYDVRMEFYENGGSAVAKLLWSYPGQAQQVIPSGNLSVNASFLIESETLIENAAVIQRPIVFGGARGARAPESAAFKRVGFYLPGIKTAGFNAGNASLFDAVLERKPDR